MKNKFRNKQFLFEDLSDDEFEEMIRKKEERRAKLAADPNYDFEEEEREEERKKQKFDIDQDYLNQYKKKPEDGQIIKEQDPHEIVIEKLKKNYRSRRIFCTYKNRLCILWYRSNCRD